MSRLDESVAISVELGMRPGPAGIFLRHNSRLGLQPNLPYPKQRIGVLIGGNLTAEVPRGQPSIYVVPCREEDIVDC